MSGVVAIVGPTATGKSALALALAERLSAEIISADALQVYRGLDIGTAKPSAEERARVPHHLVDVLAPSERFSAGEFARRARQALSVIAARHRPALVVGGSGLYLRALFSGISSLPAVAPELRERLRDRMDREGLSGLASELARVDPVTAARLAPRDAQRILRALEVFEASGVPLSTWLEKPPPAGKSVRAVWIGLTLPRAILYDGIARRVGRMMAAGWIEEVQHLLDSGIEPGAPAFQAIGYREVVRHLTGAWSRERAEVETVRATCRYAKRQQTWFRKVLEITWFEASDLATRTPELLDFLSRRGVGRADDQAEHQHSGWVPLSES